SSALAVAASGGINPARGGVAPAQSEARHRIVPGLAVPPPSRRRRTTAAWRVALATRRGAGRQSTASANPPTLSVATVGGWRWCAPVRGSPRSLWETAMLQVLRAARVWDGTG